jgi:endonuclease III
MTQQIKYVRTYKSLRTEFPDWEGVRDAPADHLEETLGDAGLAATKSRHIVAILNEIGQREGRLDLSRLRTMSDDEVEKYLISLPGVATKTARCVMLYTLDRDVFPVDAHVWRICQRLGIASDATWTDSATKRLQAAIPEGLRGSLHVTMVAHGRSVCRARKPECGECVLRDLCSCGSRNLG